MSVSASIHSGSHQMLAAYGIPFFCSDCIISNSRRMFVSGLSRASKYSQFIWSESALSFSGSHSASVISVRAQACLRFSSVYAATGLSIPKQ